MVIIAFYIILLGYIGQGLLKKAISVYRKENETRKLAAEEKAQTEADKKDNAPE